VDRLYVARDRTLITSNQAPNVTGDLTFGRGTVDVNTVVLGFQEHDGKTNWVTIGGAAPYLNFCQGRLTLTNGGLFKVNGTLTLGFTADRNTIAAAQQFNTFGQLIIYSNSTISANNLVCDTGLNYYDGSGRKNTIAISRGGSLIISNTMGGGDYVGSQFPAFSSTGLPGLPVDTLTMDNGASLTLFVDAAKTNVYVRTLLTPGTLPSIIKIATLTSNGSPITAFPARIPLIKYAGNASPFLSADVSILSGKFGFILNNSDAQTIDLFIQTNAPNNLIWRGLVDNNWDNSSSTNWVTAVGNIPTNFNLGDSVTFDDTSLTTNIVVSALGVVPGSMLVYHRNDWREFSPDQAGFQSSGSEHDQTGSCESRGRFPFRDFCRRYGHIGYLVQYLCGFWRNALWRINLNGHGGA
jgi:hypothetical protein